MSLIIPIKIQKQLEDCCGPACLQAIFNYNKLNISQEELSKELGINIGEDKGCELEDMAKVSRNFGFKAEIKENYLIDDLKYLTRKGIPAIVDWHPPEFTDGHYSIPLSIPDGHTVLADPFYGKTRELTLQQFNKRWYDWLGRQQPETQDSNLFLRGRLMTLERKNASYS